MNLVERAREFAKEKHGDRKRKYGNDPYFLHPERVAQRVALRKNTPEMVAAAYLHDLVEDEGVTLAEIEQRFGPKVAKLVGELTNEKHPKSMPRAERKRRDCERLAKVSCEAKIIKMYDRIDNLRDMVEAPLDFVRLYAKESVALLEVIRGSDDFLAEELGVTIHLTLCT